MLNLLQIHKLAKDKKRANVSTKQIMDNEELDAYSKKKLN